MTYRTINPATGEAVRTFAGISDDALEAAQYCYRNDGRHRPVADRARFVKAAAAELRANAAQYAGTSPSSPSYASTPAPDIPPLAQLPYLDRAGNAVSAESFESDVMPSNHPAGAGADLLPYLRGSR